MLKGLLLFILSFNLLIFSGGVSYSSNTSESKERKKIHNFIKEQYNPYKASGITTNHLDTINNLTTSQKKYFRIARYQIVNNKLYGEYSRPKYPRKFLILTRAIKNA